MRLSSRVCSAILAVLALAVLAMGLLRAAQPVRAHGLEGRVAEAIVLSGVDLPAFHGAAWDSLWVYAWDHDSWQFLVGQLDERDAQNLFVAGENGQLDANDEYVFMAEVLGTKRPADAWPGGLDKAHPAIEVKVTDPLVPGYEGYVYLFWSDAAPYPLVRPRVRYDGATRELSSDLYTVGFANPAVTADNFVGIKRLSLYGGQRDLVDRLKIRADATVSGFRSTFTEESLAITGDLLNTEPVKVGLLRAVLDPAGDGMAYGQRVTLFGGLARLAGFELPIIGEVQIHGVRTSLDLAPDLGEVTYRDGNTPDAVTVDGMPDTVAASPLPDWRELTFEEGRAVLLRPAPEAASAAKVYYKDDKAQDTADTGDYMSWGDNGAEATTLADYLAAGFPGQMVVLPNGGSQTAARLARDLANPIAFTIDGSAPRPTPTAAPPSPTVPSPTATVPSRTPTATAGPARHYAYLPWNGRR